MRLRGGQDLDARRLSALLHVTLPPPKSEEVAKAADEEKDWRARRYGSHLKKKESRVSVPPVPTGETQEVEVLADKIEIEPGESTAVLTFPFPAAWNKGVEVGGLDLFCTDCTLPEVGTCEPPSSGLLRVASITPGGVDSQPKPGAPKASYRTQLLAKPEEEKPKDPDFTAVVPSSIVLADEQGRGSVSLVVDNLSQIPVHFAVQGADVTRLAGPNAVLLDSIHRSVVNGAVKLSLANLVPGVPLKIVTWQEAPAKKKGDKPERKFQKENAVEVGRGLGDRETEN